MDYAIFSNSGEALGTVRGADSALDARRQWAECFGNTLGAGLRQVKAERLPATAREKAASGGPSEDFGAYASPRTCEREGCSATFSDRSAYWAHRLDHESEADND